MFSMERQQRDVKFPNSALLDLAIIANRVLIEFLGQVCLRTLHKRLLSRINDFAVLREFLFYAPSGCCN